MPRKLTIPKPLKMAINDANNGVQVFVGASRCPAVTLFPHHIAMAATRLGINRADAELLAERDQARADHAAADVALQDTLKELAEAKAEWQKCANIGLDRGTQITDLRIELDDAEKAIAKWKATVARNLDDLNATKRDLETLQVNFDQLNADFKAEKHGRKSDAMAFAAELHRAKALGWLYFGAAFVCGALAFISLVVKGGR